MGPFYNEKLKKNYTSVDNNKLTPHFIKYCIFNQFMPLKKLINPLQLDEKTSLKKIMK